MTLPLYTIIEVPTDQAGGGIILQTVPPFHLGKVLKSSTPQEYEKFISEHPHPYGVIEDYRICVLYAGTLNDYNYLQTPETGNDIKNTLQEMADWYRKEKVITRRFKFTKFLKSILLLGLFPVK